MKNILILIILMSISYDMYGQAMTCDDCKPYIEVTGTAEKLIIPDEIYLSILIQEHDKVSVIEQENLLKQMVKSLNIPLDNLTLSDASALYGSTGLWKKGVLASKTYELKCNSGKQVSDVLENLDKIKITNVQVVKVSHSQIQNLRKMVKIDAIKAAKEKSDYLLNAINQKTGKPLIIRDNDMGEYYPQPMYKNVQYEMAAADASTPPETVIDYKRIKLEGNVFVRFGIE